MFLRSLQAESERAVLQVAEFGQLAHLVPDMTNNALAGCLGHDDFSSPNRGRGKKVV
jgi:hypothetical protein